MLAVIPLMLVPFALYNLALLGAFGGGAASLQGIVLTLHMMSGADWTMNGGDLLIVAALALLFVEILKASRRSASSILDHMLSMLVFIAFLVEFLLVQGAATQIFFILMTVAFIDVVAGFSISIKAAARDVSIGL